MTAVESAQTFPVPKESLEDFKVFTHTFFSILFKEEEIDVPKRKGLDVMSQAFGYTAHPDLVRQSGGFTSKAKDYFVNVADTPIIADRLEPLLYSSGTNKNELDERIAVLESALCRSIGCRKKSDSFTIEMPLVLRSLIPADQWTMLNNEIAACFYEGSKDRATQLIKTIEDLSVLPQERLKTIVRNLIIANFAEALGHLIDIGLPANFRLNNGETIFSMAAACRSWESVNRFIEANVNLNEVVEPHVEEKDNFYALISHMRPLDMELIARIKNQCKVKIKDIHVERMIDRNPTLIIAFSDVLTISQIKSALESSYKYSRHFEFIFLAKKFPEIVRKIVFREFDLYSEESDDQTIAVVNLFLREVESMNLNIDYTKIALEVVRHIHRKKCDKARLFTEIFNGSMPLKKFLSCEYVMELHAAAVHEYCDYLLAKTLTLCGLSNLNNYINENKPKIPEQDSFSDDVIFGIPNLTFAIPLMTTDLPNPKS